MALEPDIVVKAAYGSVVEDEGDDGFLLDGFPRTVGQADALTQEFEKLGRRLTAALLVDAPDEVTPASGKYVLQVRVSFHDDDQDTVSQLRMQFPAGAVDQTTPIQQATPVNRSATVGIELIGAAPGAYEYLVSVFDEHGLESAPLTKQLTLK